MECFWLLTRLDLNLIVRREDFVRDWPPTVALDSLIPAIMVVVLGLVESDVNCVFSLVFL